MAKSKKPTEKKEVEVDRRRESRRKADDGQPAATDAPNTERRKVQRRRQIDPTTCERDYSNDEIEFMQALDAYKRTSGRMFPTCSEILEVVRGLGYERVSQPVEPPAETTPGVEFLTTFLAEESTSHDGDGESDSIVTATENWQF